jgi:hypothetical protein
VIAGRRPAVGRSGCGEDGDQPSHSAGPDAKLTQSVGRLRARVPDPCSVFLRFKKKKKRKKEFSNKSVLKPAHVTFFRCLRACIGFNVINLLLLVTSSLHVALRCV